LVGAASEWRAFREVASLQRGAAEIWQVAEWECLAASFSDRLASLGLENSLAAGAMLIAAAMYLSERTDEWGGDARDALGDLVQLGDALMARIEPAAPPL
jgi:hypothetical protein